MGGLRTMKTCHCLAKFVQTTYSSVLGKPNRRHRAAPESFTHAFLLHLPHSSWQSSAHKNTPLSYSRPKIQLRVSGEGRQPISHSLWGWGSRVPGMPPAFVKCLLSQWVAKWVNYRPLSSLPSLWFCNFHSNPQDLRRWCGGPKGEWRTQRVGRLALSLWAKGPSGIYFMALRAQFSHR